VRRSTFLKIKKAYKPYSPPTLNRFFSIHFVLPFVIAGLTLVHLALLHKEGSNSPLGSDTGIDDVPFYPYYVTKDVFAFSCFLVFFATFVFYFPNVGRLKTQILTLYKRLYLWDTSISIPNLRYKSLFACRMHGYDNSMTNKYGIGKPRCYMKATPKSSLVSRTYSDFGRANIRLFPNFTKLNVLEHSY
jgi:hypothetical protein